MIYIGADHRGFQYKTNIINYLNKKQIDFCDLGAYVFAENDDFNDSAVAVAKSVRKNLENKGILICGSAHGMVMQANRFKKIRAISATEPELIKIGREHNNANVLCLSADFLTIEKAYELIDIFLNTKFKDEKKYIQRVNRLDEREDYA